jgi:hypothetical protein
MKRYFTVFLVFIMVLSLTACGKSHNTQASGSENYHGEGQVQGGIKSDDEIAALQEEERAGTTDAQQSTSEDEIENNQQDNSNSAPGYVSADNFWNGNDFDLEGYLYANGAKWVKKGYDNGDGTGFHESDTEISYYMAYFDTTYWMVTIGPGPITFSYHGYIVDGEKWYGPYYVATQATIASNQTAVTVNGNSMDCTDTIIATLDDMLYTTICHPDSDNPFQFSENIGSLYILNSTDTDIPAGATHR